MSKETKKLLVVIGALFVFLAGGAVGVMLMTTLRAPVEDHGAGLIATKRILLKGVKDACYEFDLVVESARVKVDWNLESDMPAAQLSELKWIGPGGTTSPESCEQLVGSGGLCGEGAQIDVAFAPANGCYADVPAFDPNTQFLAITALETSWPVSGESRFTDERFWVYPLAGRRATRLHRPQVQAKWVDDRLFLWQVTAEDQEPNADIMHLVYLRRRPSPAPRDR